MATGDISAVTIRSDGWSADVTIEGWAGKQGAITYDFGDVDNANGDFVLSVVSEGYDSSGSLGTVARTVYGTKVVRQAYPNNASLDETDSGSDIVIRVALSDWVYNDDVNGGAGTSGTSPTVTIATGWANDGSNDTAAASALAVTNSSTQDYPKAFGQWAMVPYQRFTSDPTLKFTARHRHGIARVAFSLYDGTNTATGAATSATSNARSVTGLYAEEWQASVSMTTLTQNTTLTADAVLYPVVGDADSVFDTSAVTANDDNRTLGQCSYPHHCDKSAALADYCVVDSVSGNDTTGVNSTTLATAEASPVATIAKALTLGANTIYVKDAATTYNILGAGVTAPSSLGYWREVLPHPSNGSGITLQIDGAKAYNTPHLWYHGFTLQKTVQNAWMDGATGARYLRFSDCTTDANGTATPTVSTFAYRSAVAMLEDCTVDSASSFGMGQNFAARIAHWVDGCDITASAAHGVIGWTRFVACETHKIGFQTKDFGSTTGPMQDPAIFEFNRILDYSGTGAVAVKFYGTTAGTNGLSFVGNVVEKTGATTAALYVSGDGCTVAVTHALIWNNTIAGERANIAYNESGTTSYAKLLWSVVGNSFEEYNIKSDTFGTPSGNRIGNWPCLYGVGYVANCAENTIGFCNAFPGLYSAGTMGITEGESATTPGSPNYTDDQSLTTAGSGDGDYTPASPSDLLAAVPSGFEVIGTYQNGVAGDDIGAVGVASTYAYRVVSGSVGSGVGGSFVISG